MNIKAHNIHTFLMSCFMIKLALHFHAYVKQVENDHFRVVNQHKWKGPLSREISHHKTPHVKQVENIFRV